jgi:polyketide synthase PksL
MTPFGGSLAPELPAGGADAQGPGACASPPLTLGDLQDELARRLAGALEMDPDDLDLDETFYELGVESVSGVEWVGSLAAEYGVAIRQSAIYDWPTLRRFAEFLHRLISDQTPAP